MHVIVLAFRNATTAGEMIARLQELQQSARIRMVNAAELVKRIDGSVEMRETEDVNIGQGVLFGSITGGIIGLVGGLTGGMVGAATGATIGGFLAHMIDMGFSNRHLKEIQQQLPPGSSAVIVLVEHPWLESFNRALKPAIELHRAEYFTLKLNQKVIEQLHLDTLTDEKDGSDKNAG